MPQYQKDLMGGGGGEGSQLLPAPSPEISWNSCGHSGNFLEIFVIVPSSDRKRIPAWANAKLPYTVYILFWSEQGVVPGSEQQNYDDNLRKQKFFIQCSTVRPGMWGVAAVRYHHFEQPSRLLSTAPSWSSDTPSLDSVPLNDEWYTVPKASI